MKRKMIFLALLLLVLSTARVHSQVTLSSDQAPKGGAVLDLSQVSDQKLGLLLPRISLTDITVWQLQSDDADTTKVGMLVYNTNVETAGGNGPGLYVWNGTFWEPLRKGRPVLDFDLDVDGRALVPGTTVNIGAGGTRSFTAVDFAPHNAAHRGVTWTITSGDDKVSINNANKTSCTVTAGLDAGSVVLTVKSLDGNVQKDVAVDVQAVAQE